MKFLTLLYYALRSVLLRGPLQSIEMALGERQGDRQFGITTRNFVHQGKQGMHHYQGASYRVLNRIFSLKTVTAGPKSFVDIGCGLGRVLIVAQSKGYQPCVGIELNAQLAEAAIENCKVAKDNNAKSIRIYNADAREYAYGQEPTLYFLFNPFDAAVLERCLHQIEKAKVMGNVFVYMNPIHREVFLRCGYEAIETLLTGFYVEAIVFRKKI